MNPLEEHIRRINDKLQLLLKQHLLLQKENEKLKKELRALTERDGEKEKQVEELEQRVAALKTAAGNLADSDKKELEKRLNHYIREIDRCITMLAE
jgi:chromosome segregation ATPase